MVFFGGTRVEGVPETPANLLPRGVSLLRDLPFLKAAPDGAFRV